MERTLINSYVCGKLQCGLKQTQRPTAKEHEGIRFLDCTECGEELEEDFDVCPMCGYELKPVICPKCGKEISRAFNYCPYCGYKTKDE